MEQMTHDDLQELDYVERDAHGHIRLAEINFSDTLKRVLHRELERLGIHVLIASKDLGYELRCADPIALDIDYTRTLGRAAIVFLLGGGTNATVSIQGTRMVPIPFDEMLDSGTGRTEVRKVNLDSFAYQTAFNLMIRLKPEDAHNEELWKRMAAKTTLSTAAFKARFGYLVGIAPPPF